MIKERYVSLEVARLLKEKGFDEPCRTSYNTIDGKMEETSISEWGKLNQCKSPTQQMACAWLREEHNILITIIPQEIKIGIDKLCYGIYRITEDVYTPLYNGRVDSLIDSYEEAVEEALKYSLENLI